MEKNKKAWLAKVMASMSENTAAYMREAAETVAEAEIDALEDGAAAQLVRKIACLDAMRSRVEDLDNAKDLHRVGGLVPLVVALRSEHAALRWRAADALGTLSQNNPECQLCALEHGALDALLLLARRGGAEDETTRSKVLYAQTSVFLP